MDRIFLIMALCVGITRTTDGEEESRSLEDIPRDHFRAIVNLVKSGLREYPALIINGLAVATTIEAEKSEDLTFCFREDKEDKCIPTVGKMKIESDTKVGYMKVYIHAFYARHLETMVYGDDLKEAKICLAVSFNHDPIRVKIKEEMVECSECEHMDALICDYRFVGALMDGKKILPYKDMLAYAIASIGDDASDDVWTRFQRDEQHTHVLQRDHQVRAGDSGAYRSNVYSQGVIFVAFSLALSINIRLI